jgi:hypothetical protein
MAEISTSFGELLLKAHSQKMLFSSKIANIFFSFLSEEKYFSTLSFHDFII